MKKHLTKINERYFYLALAISLGLDMLYCHYLATKYQCSLSEISNVVGFHWLSVIFGIVDLIIGCALSFKAINADLSYIPKEDNEFTIEKSFIIGNTMHTFVINIGNLYNKLESIKFFMNLIFPATITIISIISLICDCLLFFKV